MLHLKNMKKYKKEGVNDGFAYMMSEDGQDWYEARELFRDDTIKIMYEDDGIIISADYVATFMAPVNCNVTEVFYDGKPEELYGMVFDGEKVVPYVEPLEHKVERLSNLHKEMKVAAINDLNTLKMSIDLDVATKSEVELFPKLKQYIIELSKLTASDFEKSDFEFPYKPQ